MTSETSGFNGLQPEHGEHEVAGLTAARVTPDVRAHPVYVVKAQMFKTLGHPVRVRILELLRDGERSVGDLQAALDLDSSGTSQHLSALRRPGLVESRRAGTSVYYRLRDPRVADLLAIARQIITSGLTDSATLLHDLEDDDPHSEPPAARASWSATTPVGAEAEDLDGLD
jgi:ArsR family transcriptional regulator